MARTSKKGILIGNFFRKNIQEKDVCSYYLNVIDKKYRNALFGVSHKTKKHIRVLGYYNL